MAYKKWSEFYVAFIMIFCELFQSFKRFSLCFNCVHTAENMFWIHIKQKMLRVDGMNEWNFKVSYIKRL